jgi:hypothetical protein
VLPPFDVPMNGLAYFVVWQYIKADDEIKNVSSISDFNFKESFNKLNLKLRICEGFSECKEGRNRSDWMSE